MKTLTRPPQTPVRPRAVAEAPHRWPKRLVAAVIAVALFAATGLVVWANRVDPLISGSVRYRIADRAAAVTVRSVEALGVSGTIQTVQTHPGQTFTYRFRTWYAPLAKAVDDATGELVNKRSTAAQWSARIQKAADALATDSSVKKYTR